ncbi:MAG: right-handed parallel beta-helix repeat-containing protein, partial [Bacteroidota bacterium]
VLQNQGTNTLSSTTIHWQVNGVAQAPFVWTGSLSEKQNAIVNIGSYNFPAGKSFKLKAWTVDANGGADCNTYNDTTNVLDLGTPLCGVYTIGGTTPDFPTFYDASVALNNAGVACPVIFKVRNGSYNEQIKLYDIPGASLSNTVLFEGENGDSTLAEIHYQLSNPSNDFTISLTGADYITFQKMGIRRTNGTYAIRIEGNAHHLSFQNCRLGSAVSPNTSCDSVLTFRFNNMQGFDIDLQNPDNTTANNITIEHNRLNNVTVTNAALITITGNRATFDTTSYAQDFRIDRSKNIVILNNRMRRILLNRDTVVTVNNNYTYNNQGVNNFDIRGIMLENSKSAVVANNNVTNYTGNIGLGYGRTRGISVYNSSDAIITNNTIDARSAQYWTAGIHVEGGPNKKITITNNYVKSYFSTILPHISYGILIESGDSIYVKSNTVDGVEIGNIGTGITLFNINNVLEVDSNTIYKFKSEGIRSRPTTGSNWKIRYNTITNIQDAGIFAEGTGGAQYIGNRISAIKAGTGIVVNGPNALIANNYIQTEGLGISKGISLRSDGTGSYILFNSVNVTGIDIINGQALEVLGGNNYTVKNNIFANNGGGYAAYVTAPVTSFNLDYNDYYSAKRRIAYFQNTNYDTLSVFAVATGKDANSKSVNPFYTSATNLHSNHTLLNETGTAIASVANDIDSTLRSATPDMGAKEFTPCANDAGVNEFWGLSNPLPVGNNDIQIVLQNQGTNMLTSATIYWQVNGIAQTPIVWNGYLPEKEDTIITIGSYNFPAGKSFQL